MSCGCTACQEALTLDPWKRVRYAHGLVLGVEEFLQEELRFLEAERRANRALHGYGAVCGLEVRVREGASGPEVFVAPGLALDPKGRWIRVPDARCAPINEWLRRNPDAVDVDEGSPALPLTLALRLCYRECETDLTPIPGGPCRTEDEAMTASRIAESFALDLTLDAPDQTELEAVRAFAFLVNRLDPVEDDASPAPTLTLEGFEAMVRGLAPLASPPGSPPGSPPASPPGSPEDLALEVPADELSAWLRAAFRIWVTEVRPALLPGGAGCAGGAPEEDCILLARLTFPTAQGAAGPVVDGGLEAVILDDHDRPVIVHTQLLQEIVTGGGVFGSEGTVVLPAPVTPVTDHGALTGLRDDDHRQYLAVQERRREMAEDVLLRNLSGGGTSTLTELPAARNPGEAMPHGQGAAGDLSGAYPAPTVTGLRGLVLPTPSPALSGRFLRLAGGAATGLRWELATPPEPGTPPEPEHEDDLTRVVALSWTHNAEHDFRFKLDGEERFGIAVAFGRDKSGPASVQIGVSRDDKGPVMTGGSLDASSFKLFVETLIGDSIAFRQRIRLAPIDLIPIEPLMSPGETLFTEGRSLSEPLAPGALLVFSNDVIGSLAGLRCEIELLGEHIIDEDGRAVDAEFTRSKLPTGDRPGDAPRGVQGGHLMSWLTLPSANGDDRVVDGGAIPGRRAIVDPQGRIAFSTASVADLMEAGGIPERAARNIVNAREADPGGIRSTRDLRAVPQVGPAVIRRLAASDRIDFDA